MLFAQIAPVPLAAHVQAICIQKIYGNHQMHHVIVEILNKLTKEQVQIAVYLPESLRAHAQIAHRVGTAAAATATLFVELVTQILIIHVNIN
jgi:hypothetical protein